MPAKTLYYPKVLSTVYYSFTFYSHYYGNNRLILYLHTAHSQTPYTQDNKFHVGKSSFSETTYQPIKVLMRIKTDVET